MQRLTWADALRGLLILLVVIGHSLQFGDYENRMSWNIIYSFHMAAFFVVSGYVSYKEQYKYSSLKQKSFQLLLPFAVWTIIPILLSGRGFNGIFNVIMRPDKSYWFIYVLFVIIAIFTIVQQKSPNSKLNICKKISIDIKDLLLASTILVLIGTMLVLEFRCLGFQFISYYFGFYVFGYWLRKYEVKFSVAQVAAIGVFWFALSLFWRMHSVPVILQGLTFLPSSLLNYSYRYLTAIVGSLFFIGFAMLVLNNSKNIIINVLCYLGKVSLGIYIIHIFIGTPITSFYREQLSSDTSLSFVLLDSVTRITISLVLIYIIQRIPIVRLLLLGKK